jgi:hypothetical protein
MTENLVWGAKPSKVDLNAGIVLSTWTLRVGRLALASHNCALSASKFQLPLKNAHVGIQVHSGNTSHHLKPEKQFH